MHTDLSDIDKHILVLLTLVRLCILLAYDTAEVQFTGCMWLKGDKFFYAVKCTLSVPFILNTITSGLCLLC